VPGRTRFHLQSTAVSPAPPARATLGGGVAGPRTAPQSETLASAGRGWQAGTQWPILRSVRNDDRVGQVVVAGGSIPSAR